MVVRARFVLMVACMAAMVAASALAQSAPGGRSVVVSAVQVDLTQKSRGPASAARTEIPRHFADPELLREIKTAYASGKAQPSKPNRTPAPPPAAVWTPGGAVPVSMSTPAAGLGEFDGGGYEPPDTTVAAGSVNGALGVLEAVNLAAQVYPSGPSLDFTVCTPNQAFDSVSDPRVLYDALDGRWFISTTTFAPTSDAGWNLLVSPSSGVLTDQWLCARILTGGIKNPDGSTGNFPDFPKIGFNSDKVVLTGDAFSTVQRGFTTRYKFQGTEFVVINKSQLLSGVIPPAATLFEPNQGDFAIEPAEHLALTSSSPDTLYMASVNSAISSTSTLDLWEVTGVPGVPTAASTPNVSKKSLPIATISTPPNAQQLGSGVLIDTNDDSLLDAVYREDLGALWVSGNDACTPPGDNATRSCARLIEVSPATLSVTQDFDVSGGAGAYLYYPAVRADAAGDLVTVFSGSSASVYPSVYTGVQKLPATANTLTNFSLVWGGDSAYAVNPPRWGDYSGAGVDPSDTAVWIAGEYATSFIFGPIWGTAITEVTP